MHIFGVGDVSKLSSLPSVFKSGCASLSSDVDHASLMKISKILS